MPSPKKSPEAGNARWIAWLLAVGYLGAAWYSIEHARESYALGYQAGRLSTAEGRYQAESTRSQAAEHVGCDANGRNCINR